MRILACIMLVVLSGCSSILEGRSQEIMINTNPEGATCILKRNYEVLGTIDSTPGSLYIEKTKYDIIIACAKKGYENATYINKPGIAGATVGNIILGGFREILIFS